jgi:hypothetical protein
MRFLDILQKFLSIAITGVVVFYAIYYFPQWAYCERPPWFLMSSRVSQTAFGIFLIIVWLIVTIGCIWFADDVSEYLEDIDWCPTWLVLFVGWVLLLTPAIILLYDKVLR